jgi:hypothetical protein
MCAAHIAGARQSPPTINPRRRNRVPHFDIPDPFPDFRMTFSEPLQTFVQDACQPAPVAENSCHLRDTTGLTVFQARIKFLSNKTLISI